MNNPKKRLLALCLALCLVFTGVVGLAATTLVHATQLLPMPGNAGIARMLYEVYARYADGEIEKDRFDSYLRTFDISTQMDAKVGHPYYTNRFFVTKSRDGGMKNAVFDVHDCTYYKLKLVGGAVDQAQLLNNFKFLQSIYLESGALRLESNYGNVILPRTGERAKHYMFAGNATYKDGNYWWEQHSQGKATYAQFAFHALDYVSPGEKGWTATLTETGTVSDDGGKHTIYQLLLKDNGGDLLRPAHSEISYEMLSALQLEVTMQSTRADGNTQEYKIPAKAVRLSEDNRGIYFDFYGEDWVNMEEDVVITDILPKVVQPGDEAPVYYVEDLYCERDSLMEELQISTELPLVDYAGNSLCWTSGIRIEGNNWMDREEAIVTAVILDASNFTSPPGSTEANWSESFSSPYDCIFVDLEFNEELMKVAPENREKIAIEWNIKDANGEYLRSPLSSFWTSRNGNGVPFTTLSFKALLITRDMEPQGQQILVNRLIGEEYIFDRVGNQFLQNEILMTGDKDTSVWPNAVTYLDTKGPSVSLSDVVVQARDSDQSIKFTVAMKITDHQPEGENMQWATASGTTASLSLNNPTGVGEVNYRYAVTQSTEFPSEEDGVQWFQGQMTGTLGTVYNSFGVGNENDNLYLHVELTDLQNYEIDDRVGLELSVWANDMADNQGSSSAVIPITGVDFVAPELQITDRKLESRRDGTVEFSANVIATDTNGIAMVGYRWVDVGQEDSAGGYIDVPQEPDENGYYPRQVGLNLSEIFAGEGEVNKVLQVTAYDKNSNNKQESSMHFLADFTKAVSQYETGGNLLTPSVHSGFTVSAPVSDVEDLSAAGSRVTVVIPGEWEDEIYFRLIGPDSQNLTVLDPEAQWYKVNAYEQYEGILCNYRSIAPVSGRPAWADYYGEMDVYIASSLYGFQAEPGNVHPGVQLGYDENGDPQYGVDPSYTYEKIGTVAYAPQRDDVYALEYVTNSGGSLSVLNSRGEHYYTQEDGDPVYASIQYAEDGSTEAYRYMCFMQTMAGARVRIRLENSLREDWGHKDIDFANSYAVLVRADEEGKLLTNDDGSYQEVSHRMLLNQSEQQLLVVPERDKEGQLFTSGVYTWVIHVAQKAGGSQTFADGRFYMILDGACISSRFGVLEHNTTLSVADGYYSPETLTATQSLAGDLEVLRSVNIGVAKPSEFLYSNEGLETVPVDGIAAYFKGVTNGAAMSGGRVNHYGAFTITADMSENGYGTYLGQEVGKVKGIRFWNEASQGDKEQVSYVEVGKSYQNDGVNATLRREGALTYLDVLFDCGWYMDTEAAKISNVYSPEELANKQKNQFAVSLGTNVIAYQMILENGLESPVYTFRLNLIDETPQVNVDFELGPYYISYYDDNNNGIDDGYYVHETEYAVLRFSDVLSNYGDLKVHQVTFRGSEYSMEHGVYYEITQLTQQQITEGITLTEGNSCIDSSSSYNRINYGYAGTSITGMHEASGTEIFFVITDGSGNAVTIYPIDNTSLGTSYVDPFTPRELRYQGVFEADENSYYMEYDGLHSIHDTEVYYTPWNYDSISFQMDDLDEASSSFAVESNVTVPNGSGFAAASEDGFFFMPPYDPERPEGEELSHTATITIYGVKDSAGVPNFTHTHEVEFTAPNVKPAVETVEALAGCIVLHYNIPVAVGTTAAKVEYLPVTDASVYGSTLSHSFTDLYGCQYTQTIQVPEVADPVVTYSTTEPTTGEVTVTVESAVGNLYTELSPWGDEPVYVEGEGSNKLTLVFVGNAQVNVYYDSDCTQQAAWLEVSNIFDTLEVDPYIAWDYSGGDIIDGVVYREVTAYLVDANGATLIDPKTGQEAYYTFVPGGETEYTFTGCYSDRGTAEQPILVEDMTASLTVTLAYPEVTEDTLAPDVDIEAFVTQDGLASATQLVYRQSSGRFPQPNYAVRYGVDGENFRYYDDMNRLMGNMGWADSYMFHLHVYDESNVRLILGTREDQDSIRYRSESAQIQGVSLVGRTLEISENAEFVLYLVDEYNNVTGIYFNASCLEESHPQPQVAQVEAMDGEGNPLIRVYLLPPALEGYSELAMTNAGAMLDEENYEDEFASLYSDYRGLYYLEFSSSADIRVEYSYLYRGQLWTGSIPVSVTVPAWVSPTVVKELWSANYYAESTAQPVSLQLSLNKAVRDVQPQDARGYAIADNSLKEAGLFLTYFEDRITVIFEENTTALLEEYGSLRLKLTSTEDNQVGYYELAAVTCIDHSGPVISEPVIEYSDNRREAEILLTTDEPAVSQERNAYADSFRFTVRENGDYSYSFADLAGNLSTVTVTVDGLVTEPLVLQLSTTASENGILEAPETYAAEIGQTLYARVNRAATLCIYGRNNEEQLTRTDANVWVPVVVTENSMGMHPSVIARDAYGNINIVQLEYIPVRDITAPAVILHKELVSVSQLDTKEQILQTLLDNILYSDDSTPRGELEVTVDYDESITSGRTIVTYTVTDAQGNATVRQCWLRIRNGLEPKIMVNGVEVLDGSFLYINGTADLEINVSFSAEIGEPYKLVYEKGDLRSWAKLKDGLWLTPGYTDRNGQSYQIQDMEDGWYSFALTTQGMEIYYFQVHIGPVGS